MQSALRIVKASYDSDAEVWFVESSDIPGLNLEAPTLDALRAKLPDAISDLLEHDQELPKTDLAIELIAHASLRVRHRTAA